jgi:dethiobiotin synthetase
MKRVFVSGTDTGVGKTMVACAIAAAFARRRMRVGVMKPCETGGGDDAVNLIAATGRSLAMEDVSPFRFALPASPEVAALAAGGTVRLDRIGECYARLARNADVMIVEGAGGLLVPLGEGKLMADLVSMLELPLVIVARPSLGTVNHTLLTIEAARSRGLSIAGVVFSSATATGGPDEPTNPAAIERYGAVEILGRLPVVTKGQLADAGEQLALDRLLSLI